MADVAILTPGHGVAVAPGTGFNVAASVQRDVTSWTLGIGTSPRLADLGSDNGGPLLVPTPPLSPQITLASTAPNAGNVWAWFTAYDTLGEAQHITHQLPVVGSYWTGFDWFEGSVLDYVETAWAGFGDWSPTPSSTESPPSLRWPNRQTSTEIGGPLLEVHFIWTDREAFGGDPCKSYRSWGIMQHDVIVREGIGTLGLMQLLDRIGPMWDSHTVPGLSTYAPLPPREATGVPAGWYGRQVDVRFRWEWTRQDP